MAYQALILNDTIAVVDETLVFAIELLPIISPLVSCAVVGALHRGRYR